MSRVLVVDDDASVRKLVEHVLRHAGYDVVTAEDGHQALARLDATIDILLCDKSLPGLLGTQVVLEARGRFPHLTTVLMTATPEALALNNLGLDGYIAKPFRSNATVVQTLRAAVEHRANTDHRQEIDGAIHAGLEHRARR